MQLLIARGQAVQAPFVFGHHGVELAVGVTPFAHTPHIDEVLPQQGLVLAVAEFVFLTVAAACFVNPIPQG